MCTINKSAHAKKSGNLFNYPRIYAQKDPIYIYIYIYIYISTDDDFGIIQTKNI